MRINNNIMAMNAHRQLGVNQANASKSMERLSSGMRINRAGDDAAGLAISEKMRGQIRGLKQASRNAQDGISLIQTAEGALNETHAILQRMRELAVQAASDTNVDELDREAINNEIAQLKEEIDRIANTTEFNTQKLIDGSIGARRTAGTKNAAVVGSQVGKQTSAALTGTTGASPGEGLLQYLTDDNETIYVDGAKLTIEMDSDKVAAYQAAEKDGDAIAALLQDDINAAIDAYNEARGTNIEHVTVTFGSNNWTITSGTTGANSTIEVAAGKENGLFDILGIIANDATSMGSAQGSEGVYTAGGAGAVAAIRTLTGDDAKAVFTVDGKSIAIDFSADESNQKFATNATQDAASGLTSSTDMESIRQALETDLNNAIKNYNITAPEGEKVKEVTVSVKDGSFVVQSGSEDAASSVKFDSSEAFQLLGLAGQSSATQGGGIDFQIGANRGQTMNVTIEDMRSDALGIADISLATKEDAQDAMDAINTAINKVSDQRSALGAFQNRLEHTISNLNNSAENLQAAESRVRDLDMAEEIMAFTKNNILQQAATAMLAQANMAPQSVLQLLG